MRLEKEFVGVEALRSQQKAGLSRRLVGLLVAGKNIAREGYSILAERTPIGSVTSGSYSPTLDRAIAMGYVTIESSAPSGILGIDIRGRATEAEVVSLPFYSRSVAR